MQLKSNAKPEHSDFYAPVNIQDIIIIAPPLPNEDKPPCGEFGRELPAETSEALIDRLHSNILSIMQKASSEHSKNNCLKNKPLVLKKGSENNITRVVTNEFFFYTMKPLSLAEFNTLLDKIKESAKTMPENLHLILGSFAVQLDENTLMNVTPYISCGANPDIRCMVKNNASPIDPVYTVGSGNSVKNLVNFTSKNSKLLQNIDSKVLLYPCSYRNVLDCTTAGGSRFTSIVDICLDHQFKKGLIHFDNNILSQKGGEYELVAGVTYDKNEDPVTEHGKIHINVTPIVFKKLIQVKKKPEILWHKTIAFIPYDQYTTFYWTVGLKIHEKKIKNEDIPFLSEFSSKMNKEEKGELIKKLIPIADLPQKKIEYYVGNYEKNKGEIAFSEIDCHEQTDVESIIKNKNDAIMKIIAEYNDIPEDIGNTIPNAFLPKQYSQILVSNSIRNIEESCLIENNVTHADPIYSMKNRNNIESMQSYNKESFGNQYTVCIHKHQQCAYLPEAYQKRIDKINDPGFKSSLEKIKELIQDKDMVLLLKNKHPLNVLPRGIKAIDTVLKNDKTSDFQKTISIMEIARSRLDKFQVIKRSDNVTELYKKITNIQYNTSFGNLDTIKEKIKTQSNKQADLKQKISGLFTSEESHSSSYEKRN